MVKWDKYIDAANGYHKAAAGAFKKGKLGSQVVFNLLSMSVENYFTALCLSIGEMPEQSLIADIQKQVGKKVEMPANFREEVRFMTSFMNFCSLEILEMKNPTCDELKRMLGFADELKLFCEKELGCTVC